MNTLLAGLILNINYMTLHDCEMMFMTRFITIY